jgi:hypothetical protein
VESRSDQALELAAQAVMSMKQDQSGLASAVMCVPNFNKWVRLISVNTIS